MLTLTPFDGTPAFDFTGLELPEHIMWGGEQRLAVHELVGGGRVIDRMGAQPRDIAWNALFFGEDGFSRSQQLDTMRKSGKAFLLTFYHLSYTVTIESFSCDFRLQNNQAYTITLKVDRDNSQAVAVAPETSVDQQIAADIAAGIAIANAMQVAAAQQAQLNSIKAKLTTLQTIQQGISSFATATTEAINSVLAPVADIRQASQQLLAQIDNLVQNVTTLGGIAPYNPVAVNAAHLTDQANNLNSSYQLVQLDGVLGRVQHNTTTASSGPRTVTTGGTLYQVAQDEYGDATLWTAIAKANGMRDPQINGTQTLIIPANPVNTGGVLDV